MKKPEERITDCEVNGYEFGWLRSSKDYELAGKRLKNCLVSWDVQDSPVVCVKKDGRYLAAIEICEGEIIQARGYGNSNINGDPELYLAFEKWRKRFKLEWNNIW